MFGNNDIILRRFCPDESARADRYACPGLLILPNDGFFPLPITSTVAYPPFSFDTFQEPLLCKMPLDKSVWDKEIEAPTSVIEYVDDAVQESQSPE